MAGQLTSIEFLTFAILKKEEIFMDKICKKKERFSWTKFAKEYYKK